MANDLIDDVWIDARVELVGDKSVSEVVDFGFFYSGFGKKAINCRSDIADKQRVSSFGYEDMRIGSFGPHGEIILERRCSLAIEWYWASGIVFKGTNVYFVFGDVFQSQVGQFSDPDASLQEELNDSTDSNIQSDGVSETKTFFWCQNVGSFSFVFGMAEGSRGVLGMESLFVQKLKKRLDRVYFSTYGFGCIAFGGEVDHKLFKMRC